MSKHVHAELMAQIAEDAKTSATPWDKYEYIQAGIWKPCTIMISFDKHFEYRRKSDVPEMTEADWKRVVNEGFYIRNKTECRGTLFNAKGFETGYIMSLNKLVVVREKGLRQPHFQGHPHPEGGTMVHIKYGPLDSYNVQASDVAWDDVVEYIEL